MGRRSTILSILVGALALFAFLSGGVRERDIPELRGPAARSVHPADREPGALRDVSSSPRLARAPTRDEAPAPVGSNERTVEGEREGRYPRTDVLTAHVSGKVLGPLGDRVTDAEVVVLGPTSSEELGPPIRTNADGTFALDLTPGHPRLVARAQGAASSPPFQLHLESGQSSEGVTLALRECGALVVDVLNGEGQRPESAEFRIRSDAGEEHRDTSTRAFPVRFDDLAPGEVEIRARFLDAPMRTRSLVARAEIQPGESVELVLGGPLERPVRVFGHVFSLNRPCPGVAIAFARYDPDGSAAGTWEAISDESGRYALLVDGGGSYDVSLQRETGSAASHRIELPDDREEVSLDLELPAGSIAGTVRDVRGEPAGHTTVRVEPDRRSADLSSTFSYDSALTDDEGRYLLDGLHAGNYEVVAGEPAEVGTRALELEEGQALTDVDLVLRAGAGTVVGRVIDAAGVPVAGVQVTLLPTEGTQPPGGPHATDEEGRFEIATAGVPGVALVAARTAELVAPLAGPIVLGPGSSDDVELVLAPGGQLVVSVREPDGRAVGAALRVLFEGVDVGAITRQPGVAGDARTGERFGPLPPGTYEVTAENHDRVRVSRTVRILVGEEAAVELVLGGA